LVVDKARLAELAGPEKEAARVQLLAVLEALFASAAA
jgi:hypothetical protein